MEYNLYCFPCKKEVSLSMKKSLLYIVFTCLFAFSSWGQEKNKMLSSQDTVEQDATPKLSRFLQNIHSEKDYAFSFDRDFLKPKGMSLRRMLKINQYSNLQSSKENIYSETFYPNINYPSGILINQKTNYFIKSFPEVN